MTVEAIRALLTEAFDGPAWHGPHLQGALQRVRPSLAARRPGRGRPSIWELAVHCAYWKHRVRQRIAGTREPFARPGGDWSGPPRVVDARAWRADRALLASEHRALLDLLGALPERALGRPARGHGQTPREMLVGVAFHDVYHAGQIRLLRKLFRA